jgi:hypothetical protein
MNSFCVYQHISRYYNTGGISPASQSGKLDDELGLQAAFVYRLDGVWQAKNLRAGFIMTLD